MNDTCRQVDAGTTAPYRDRLAPWIEQIRLQIPEFEALRSDRVLITAGAARRHHTASVRPLTFGGAPPAWTWGRFQKPIIRWKGRFQFAEVTLRPLFFRTQNAEGRLRILLHELWHIGAWGLEPERRHGRFDEAEHRRWLDRQVRQVTPPGDLLEPGPRPIHAWLERPPTRLPRDRAGRGRGWRIAYDERDLYVAWVDQL